MKGIKVIHGTGFLFLVMVLCFPSIEAYCADVQPVQVELVSIQPSFTGSESISLMPVYRLTNPNKQLVSVTIKYTLTQKKQMLKSSQIKLVYVPSGRTVLQKDSLPIKYMALILRKITASNKTKTTAEVIKTLLPL